MLYLKMIWLLLNFNFYTGNVVGTKLTESFVVNTTEAFYIPINKNWFESINEDDADVEYQASLLNMPDLPRWLHCRHPNGSETAYLYGAPETAGDVHIEIIAMNRNNYETSRHVVSFNVAKREKEARNEVELKFTNLNVEDLFEDRLLTKLVEIFEKRLWEKTQQSDTIYVTMIASAVDLGGRVPLKPTEKEGVVVRIGSSGNFSHHLLNLEREVLPLWQRVRCPPDFVRTSVESLFRDTFISDWCKFRLIRENQEKRSSYGQPDPSYSSISLTSDEFRPQTLSLPRRDFMVDFIVSIVVPAVVLVLLLTSLICIMCCGREGLEKRNRKTTSVQMNQYNSIQKASSQLRQMTSKRDSLTHSGSTPGSSLPRSHTGSPSSTLPKTSTPRSASRTGTLRSGGPPPPPPYTPLRTGSMTQPL